MSNNYQTNEVGLKIWVCALGLTVMATVLVPGIAKRAIFPKLDRSNNPTQHQSVSPDTTSIGKMNESCVPRQR